MNAVALSRKDLDSTSLSSTAFAQRERRRSSPELRVEVSSVTAYGNTTPTARDAGLPDVAWLEPVITKLVNLMNLPPGWDGRAGRALSIEVAEYVVQLLCHTMPDNAVLPHFVPMPDGGVGMEWHRKGMDLEIVIEKAGNAEVFWHDLASDKSDDVSLTSDFSALRGLVHTVATP